MRKTVAFLLCVLTGTAAVAADVSPLVVVFDKAQVVHLAAPARRVIVANPAIADVSVEEPTLLYVFGKAPGETSITVLGADNRELLSRSVVVTTEPDRMVTVYRPGAEGPVGSHYSCVANRCLKVASPETVAATAIAPAAPANGGGATTTTATGR